MQHLKRNLLSVALASATLMLAQGAYAQTTTTPTTADQQDQPRPQTWPGSIRIRRARDANGTPDRAQARGEVAFDVEMALDVCTGDAELAGRPQDVPQRPLVTDDEHRCAVGAGLAAVPRSEADREADAQGVLGQGEESAGDVHRSIELWPVGFRHLNLLSHDDRAGMLFS